MSWYDGIADCFHRYVLKRERRDPLNQLTPMEGLYNASLLGKLSPQVKFRRYSPLPPSTQLLTEGMAPPANTMFSGTPIGFGMDHKLAITQASALIMAKIKLDDASKARKKKK